MAAEVNNELNNIIECCICAEIFTDPRILPCIHTFCVKCLTETGLRTMKGPGDLMPCPLCRAEFTIPKDGFTGLKKNFFMDKLLEVALLSKQNVCNSNEGNCTSACNACKQILREECSTEYSKAYSQEAHHLVPFENQREVEKSLEVSNQVFCDKHEGEELKIYCNDCQLAKCALCFLGSHQTHKWSPVKEVAKKFRMQIASNAVLLSDCVPEAQNKIDQLEKQNVEFLKILRQVESEVKKKQIEVRALFEKIMQEDTSSLISTLTSCEQARSKRSKIEKEDLDGHLTKLNSYIMFCNDIAANGSDVDICRIVNESNSTAKELKDLHRTVIQRNSGPLHLCFEERKAEDFTKTFHGNILGKIEVTVPDQDNASPQQLQKSSAMYNSRDLQVTTPRTPVNVPQHIPTHRYMPFAVPLPGRRPPTHWSEQAYSSPLATRNNSDGTSSQATKTKTNNALAIIDPNTGQNVLHEISNKALKIKTEFAHKVTQRIFLGDTPANLNSDENKPEESLYGARPRTLFTTAPAASLFVKEGNAQETIKQDKPEEKVRETVSNLGHSEANTIKPHRQALISTTKPLERMEKTEPKKGTINSRNFPQSQMLPSDIRGRITYDREFLLRLRHTPESLKRPPGLPHFDIVLDNCRPT